MNSAIPTANAEKELSVRIPVTSSEFVTDEGGTIAVLWAISLVAVLGLTAMVFEAGKLSTTQSELQAFVDNVAIAAAGELDGNPDAITRATNAANTLISDSTTWGLDLVTDDRVLSGAGDFALRFHSAIPADDTAPLGANVTTDPRNALFAEVTATPRSVTMTFLRVLNNLLGRPAAADPQVSATAVAGFTQAACDITPLMFCLPANYETTLGIGDMILLRSGGSGAAWGPGDFGFIDLDNFQDTSGVCADEGGNKLACLLAAQDGITQCIIQRGIDTEPGQKVGITNAAFNVRFDMYRAVLNGEKNDPDFAPAPNVIKGIKPKGGGSCIQGSEEATGNTIGLPRDTCFPSGCGGNNRFGDGVWDRAHYLNVNHGGSDLPALSPADPTVLIGSRYDMYRREIQYGDSGPFSNPNKFNILNPSLAEFGASEVFLFDPGRLSASSDHCCRCRLHGQSGQRKDDRRASGEIRPGVPDRTRR